MPLPCLKPSFALPAPNSVVWHSRPSLHDPSTTRSQLCPLHPKPRATCHSPNRFDTALPWLLLFPLPGTPFPASTPQWWVWPGSGFHSRFSPSPHTSLYRLFSSTAAPVKLHWLQIVYGYAPTSRAQTLSCPFCVLLGFPISKWGQRQDPPARVILRLKMHQFSEALKRDQHPESPGLQAVLAGRLPAPQELQPGQHFSNLLLPALSPQPRTCLLALGLFKT